MPEALAENNAIYNTSEIECKTMFMHFEITMLLVQLFENLDVLAVRIFIQTCDSIKHLIFTLSFIHKVYTNVDRCWNAAFVKRSSQWTV